MKKNNYYYKIVDKYWAELFTLCISLFLICNFILNEKINDQTKFVNLNGKVIFSEFKDGSRGYHYYYFNCDKYCNNFQISANFLQYFDKSKFPKNDDKINFVITKNSYKKIQNCEKILVYGITSNNQKVLDFQKVIEFEKNSYFFLFPYFLILGATVSILIKNRR